ncbi:hypothetical protein PR003_g30804, partial [Phytophthora rubi]
MVKRSSKARRGGSAVDQLQAALTRSLKDSVAEAVGSVCESYQQALDEQAAAAVAVAASPAEESAGYDQYYSNCRRLVDYIQQNMEASSGFSEQMDRIILACHSGATERVLSSVVTKQLWFHTRGDAPERETRSSRKSSSSSGRSGASRAAKKKVKRELSSSSSATTRMATRATTESPAMHTRSASGGKRSTRSSTHDEQPVKRPRRAARKVIHDSSEDEEDVEKEEEEEEEEEEEKKPAMKKSKGKKKKQEEQDDDDELLSFKDAIGELCYPDRRTPTETKFFKERLRKSIQFVDALLCKPPAGKVCGRGCKKVRAQMCSSSTPCKNKMCRIWHDVEAHTDRCQNQQCEFKNRILLRETMHKLDMKKQQIAAVKTELEGKRAQLKEAADGDKDELEDEIASLEHDLEECDSELSVHETTKKTFWDNLNEIGIEVGDDVVDGFPDFATHYEEKKAPRKAATTTTTHLSSASSRGSRAAARRASSGPHGSGAGDDEEENDADSDSVGDNIPRRTARRSTSSGRHSVRSHNESDEETKGGDEEMKEGDAGTFRSANVIPRPDEPPLPPAGPPPFRQNPELDRAYAAAASGYSIQPPPADDLEAPAVAMEQETPGVTTDFETPVAMEQEPPATTMEFEAPNAMEQDTQAVTMDHEPTKQAEATVETDALQLERLADAQRASDEISGIMAGFSANPPLVDPVNTTGFTIRGNQ